MRKPAKTYEVYQFRHKSPTVSWRSVEVELDIENECITCGKSQRKDSAFCSYFCRIEYKRAA